MTRSPSSALWNTRARVHSETKMEASAAFDVADMDFKESFNTLNTFQAAAPIGKYIDGSYNTTLIMSGLLDKDMMPRLSSVSADGFMETLNGIIKGVPALNAIGDKLGMQTFDKMEIKN